MTRASSPDRRTRSSSPLPAADIICHLLIQDCAAGMLGMPTCLVCRYVCRVGQSQCIPLSSDETFQKAPLFKRAALQQFQQVQHTRIWKLTDHDAEGPEGERLWPVPEEGRLQHADGDDHRVGGLVVVRVDGGHAGDVLEAVPEAARVRREVLQQLRPPHEHAVLDQVHLKWKPTDHGLPIQSKLTFFLKNNFAGARRIDMT